MASVISEKHGGRTRYRIQFRDGNKRRRSIRLSGLNRKAAEAICSRVETLNAAKIAGQPLDTSTAQWLSQLGDELHEKLVAAGLAEARRKATLAAFIDGYMAGRSDVEERTQLNWQATRNKFTAYFGDDCGLRGISEGDADDWRQSLCNKHAEATVAGHVKRAKQFFRYAQRKKLVDANVFAGLQVGRQHNEARQVFVERTTIDRVLKACPDAEWRLIVALARYGGLRTPSEVLNLRWCDINWEGKRLTVTSPKTKKQGKSCRVVPLFPELEPALVEAFDQAREGAVYCIERYRSQDVNLRTHLLRIVGKAGVEPWEKPLQNLRASRETELANVFPLHVVTAWLGNTPRVAEKHYLQVTDAHFTQATAEGGAGGGATGGAAACRKRSQGIAKASEKQE